MSRSQLVAEHLPLLRRYARALTGSQTSGDAYVAAMLEALLQDGSLLDERHGPRAGLFKLFTQIWNSVSLNENPEVTHPGAAAGAPAVEHHAAAAAGLPAAVAGRLFRGRGRLHPRHRHPETRAG